MGKIEILEEIRNNRKLLSLPQVLSEILAEVGKEDFSADSLAQIILKDPSLTGNILKLANSPFYHRFSEITTVNQAVSMLGVTTVKCLALSSSIFHPDKIAEESGVDSSEFFGTILSVAVAAEEIAKTVGYKSPEEALIAGLMNDLGIMYFLHHHPENYRRVLQFNERHKNLMDAEKDIFGIDHAEVGASIATSWRLPEYIVQSIMWHHREDAPVSEKVLPNIVRLATLMTPDSFSPYKMPLEERLHRTHALADVLSISHQQLDVISISLLGRSVEMADFIGVDIGNYEDMLSRANREIWKSFLTIENLFIERQEISGKLLNEERLRGAVESNRVALATLSHYLNNSLMAIYGRSQILRMLHKNGQTEKLMKQLPSMLETIDKSVKKVVAVMEEMKDMDPADDVNFYKVSRAMNIDDRIEKRVSSMSEDVPWDAQIESRGTGK